jgi:disulfide bond formation protein DsbB
MKSNKLLLIAIALACFGLIGGALYFQIVEEMLPCPWCVIQRYLFLTIGIICLISAFLPPNGARRGVLLAALFALGGVGAGSWHNWIMAHPKISCGLDPLETSLNHIFPAKILPIVFRADGICTTPYDPFLGLQLPQWALLWFIAMTIALGFLALRRKAA